MTNTNDRFEYDVALFFAGPDRVVAQSLAQVFQTRNMNVLLDDYEATRQSGTDVLTHIGEIFRTKAWYCLLLISPHSPLKSWTDVERTSVQQHALRDPEEHILPILVEDNGGLGIGKVQAAIDVHDASVDSIVDLVDAKLGEIHSRPGPPSQSHDLRSGNVPPAHKA
jgi:hypothetical protein